MNEDTKDMKEVNEVLKKEEVIMSNKYESFIRETEGNWNKEPAYDPVLIQTVWWRRVLRKIKSLFT